jgi:tripartite-type tricarboxylate transporter receptor subunit TctC
LVRALGGQPVVIENMPGAGGVTGTAAIVQAAPDGSTIGVIFHNHAVNPSVFKKLPYDSLNGITPISVVGATPFVLVVNPSKLPVTSAKELQALLKAKPGSYNYVSSGKRAHHSPHRRDVRRRCRCQRSAYSLRGCRPDDAV